MSSIISRNQSGFIQGRIISDNILVAQEMIKGYSRKGLSPRCSMKIDIHKAYDTMSWTYLRATLVGVGLPPRFISWIMQAVSTPSYTIKINGSYEGFFKGTRGLRQDPFLPTFSLSTWRVFQDYLGKLKIMVTSIGIRGAIKSG